MNKYHFLILFVLMAVLLAGCEPTSPPPTQPSAELTTEAVTDEPVIQTEVPTEALPTEPPVIIYQDDFSDTESGWERSPGVDGMLDYDNDGYRMRVPVTNNLYWVQANLPEPLADVAVEVEVTKLSGPEAAPFGVLCRLDDRYQYYYFFITAKGEYGIGKHTVADGSVLIGMDAPGYSDVVNQGDNVVNKILAVCTGQTLSLTVNGQLLAEIQDGELSQGDVGLLAGVLDEPNIDVWFDYITLMEP